MLKWLLKLLKLYRVRQANCINYLEPRGTLCPQKLALASPKGGCRSVGIVRLRTKATEEVSK
jgi:hypothetical protein